jgi:hypothetical protein
MLSPRRSARLQRRAISTVFSSASGRSANSSAISAALRRYCCGVYLRGRDGSASNVPSWMQTRASCDSKSAGVRNRTSLVATTGTAWRSASASVAAIAASSSGRPTRVSSR